MGIATRPGALEKVLARLDEVARANGVELPELEPW